MPDVDLNMPIQFVPGVGPARAQAFATLGVRTVEDLLHHYPFRYETFPRSVPIGHLEIDRTATVIGTIRSVRSRRNGRHPSLTADVVDGTGRMSVRWFNADYLANRLHAGQIIRMTGKVDVRRDLAQFVNPRFDIIEDDADPLADDVDRLVPVYPATAVVNTKTIARIIAGLLGRVTTLVTEILPDPLRERHNLPPRATAVARIHQPITPDDARIARRRLAYDELLLLQLAVQAVRHHRRTAGCARPISVSAVVDQRIRKRFPFPLTPGQDAAVKEITADLSATQPMNRLLQGDVGCGKTAVALYAALAAIASRRQVTLLAPTELLARQHHRNMCAYLDGSRVNIQRLVGADSAAHRSGVLTAAATGDLDLLIGTHALLERDITYNSLGLVIIDEQHKFGVAQRAAARHKGITPHVLVMTATPIPRTLAMTFFGDLDITTIRDAPPGRHPVRTRRVRTEQLHDAWSFLRERLDAGEQAYIVYPLVEESDALPLKALTTEYETLRVGPLRDYNVALVHGRTASAEKESVMNAFRDGGVRVLLSTTVIEVGVDVPNATVMIVEHAERFGLAQLHQLRGRIGRGCTQAYCLLVSDAESGYAAQRLDVMTRSSDGFDIAEADLRLRGPGELLGIRQHGLPRFKAADLLDDFDLLTTARDDAARTSARDPALALTEHQAMRAELRARYGQLIPFVDVG